MMAQIRASSIGTVYGPDTSRERPHDGGGGQGEVCAEIVATALADVARPYKPKETPADYLRELFWNILKALHGRSTIAKLVVLQLSTNPLLVPRLAERLLICLAELGLPKETLARAFHHAMGAIFEMIFVESVRSKPSVQKSTGHDIIKKIGESPSTEFSNLTDLCEALATESLEAAKRAPAEDVAEYYSNRLMTALNSVLTKSRRLDSV